MALPRRLRWIAAAALLTISAAPAIRAQERAAPDSVARPPIGSLALRQESAPWIFRGTDNLTTLLGYLVALGAACWAYRQWRTDQRWKRQEVLMERIRAFDDSPGVRNAMMMLTSHDRDIPLWDKEKPEERYVRVTWGEVKRALIPASRMEYAYDPKQTAIRDSFEDFLGRLSHIETYIEAGLLDARDARHVIAPWIARFKRLSADPQLLRNLRLYIDWRGLRSVQKLFHRFGVNLRKDLPEADRELAAEIERGEWSWPQPEGEVERTIGTALT